MTKKLVILFFALFFLQEMTFSQTTIKMKREGGVSIVPCKVNGLALSFIFDTGASDVTISLTEATFMLKNGYLRKEDIIGTANYSNANGQISEGYVIILREIEFAGVKLTNVTASIVKSSNAPLLLGQSAISKLGKIQVDLAANTITIFNTASAQKNSSANNEFEKAPTIKEKKSTTIPTFYEGNLTSLSTDKIKSNLLNFYYKYVMEKENGKNYDFNIDGEYFTITYYYKDSKYIESVRVNDLTQVSTYDLTFYLGTGRGMECNCGQQLIYADEPSIFANYYLNRKDGNRVLTDNGELINKVPNEQLYYLASISTLTLKPTFKKDYKKFKAALIELAKRQGKRNIKFHTIGNI